MREVIKDSCIRNELLEIFYGLTRKGADRPLDGNPMDRLADVFDLASANQDREMNIKLLERERERFQEILDVLHRINVGTYAVCEECGGEIGLERLKAHPTTRLCIECKIADEAARRSKEGSWEQRPRERVSPAGTQQRHFGIG